MLITIHRSFPMPRPLTCRIIASDPDSIFFKPRGVPMSALETVVLTRDECEALRLADMLGLYHEEAAQRMDISRQTFGRIIESARRKIATAIIEGKAFQVSGGEVRVEPVDGLRRCCRRAVKPRKPNVETN